MLICAVLLWGVLPAVSAPTWCYMCTWITLVCKVLSLFADS